MMLLFRVLLIFSLIFVGTSSSITRFLSGLFYGKLPECTRCPLRNCLNDEGVILGYCCGCARVTDYLPIDCHSIHLHCPVDGRKLCRDYDYMLNCCCP